MCYLDPPHLILLKERHVSIDDGADDLEQDRCDRSRVGL